MTMASTGNAGQSYFQKFQQLLDTRTSPIDSEDLFSEFTQSRSTVAKYLRYFLNEHPQHIVRIIGFYPSADTVINLAEGALGPIAGANVVAINEHCKATIDSITKPRHRRFLSAYLDGHLETDRSTLRLNKEGLVDFLYEEYVDFVHESDNGLVSIAGGMNEKILMRGLANSGLSLNEDFKKTGTNSEGDIQIEHRGRTTEILYCEIKSYAARERLLRGLQDIPHPKKVGVGFFTNAAEFNPDRTQTLLAAGPWAIYLPDTTYALLSPDSAIQTTNRQDKLYRPLSRFFPDMVEFKNRGTIPPYR